MSSREIILDSVRRQLQQTVVTMILQLEDWPENVYKIEVQLQNSL